MKTRFLALLFLVWTVMSGSAISADSSIISADTIAEFRVKAEQGDAKSQYSMGMFYQFGFGVSQDSQEAAKWYRKAADQGDSGAQYCLGNLYSDGDGVPKDLFEAVKWYRKAAELADESGMYSLAECYVKGEGVSQDIVEAFKWFTLTAAQDQEFSKIAIEQRTKLAKRMTADQIAEAEKLSNDWKPKVAASTGLTESLADIQVKAEQGDAETQYRLALRYEEGKGVPKDVMEAAKWHHKAAEQGHVGGQVRLAHFYHTGYGRPKDMVEAYKWYNLAASHGSITLSKMRDIMASKMTPEQVAEAQKLSREWRPKTTK